MNEIGKVMNMYYRKKDELLAEIAKRKPVQGDKL